MDEKAPANQESVYVTNVWTRRILQPISLTLLVTAIFAAVLNVINQIVPFQGWFALLPLIGFAALEGIYTSFWIEHPDRRVLDRTTYRFAEYGILLVGTRIFTLVTSGQGIPTFEEFRLYLRTPLAFFTDGYFIVALLLVTIAWRLAINQANKFQQLAVSPVEAHFYTLPPSEQARTMNDRPLMIQRSELLTSFFHFWVWGGVVMIVATALSTFPLADIASVRNPFALARLGLRPLSIIVLLTYFLTGFWLLSQGRLQVMNARWLINGVRKKAGIEQRWQRSSLLILLSIALVAAFVPVGSTLPISRLLNTFINLVIYVVGLIWYVMTLLVFSLLLPLFNLLRGQPAETETEPLVSTPPPLQEVLDPQSPPPIHETSQLLFSSFFWTVIIFLAVSAFLYYLRERGVEVNQRTVRRLWGRFTVWLRQVWQGLATQTQTLRRTIRLRNGRAPSLPPPQPKQPWRFIRVNALPPREQIRYFYLSVVRRASETGIPRRADETPLEYLRDLKQSWPEHEEEIEELTQAFLAARYTTRPVDKGWANAIKTTWKRLRSVLRQRVNSTPNPPKETE